MSIKFKDTTISQPEYTGTTLSQVWFKPKDEFNMMVWPDEPEPTFTSSNIKLMNWSDYTMYASFPVTLYINDVLITSQTIARFDTKNVSTSPIKRGDKIRLVAKCDCTYKTGSWHHYKKIDIYSTKSAAAVDMIMLYEDKEESYSEEDEIDVTFIMPTNAENINIALFTEWDTKKWENSDTEFQLYYIRDI